MLRKYPIGCAGASGTQVAHPARMTLAKTSLGLLSALVLLHCASPDLPGTEGAEGAGTTESGSPAGKATLPPKGNDSTTGASSAPAGSTAPGVPPLPAPVASCDLTKPFAAPIALDGFTPGAQVATPRLSHDELTIYFTTHDASGKARLARSVRTSLAAPFSAPVVLDAQSSTAKDNDPSISADGASLWFSSERAGGSDRLFMAPLLAGTTTFGAPTLVPLAVTGADDQHPYFRVAGGELWFSSTRDGQWDIYVATKRGASFDAPRRVDELHSSAASRQPMVTEDGLTILFSSERAGGAGKRDLWMAHRATVASPFGSAEVLSTVASAADEFAGWISNDGCRVYFSSDRSSTVHRAYVAARPAK